MKILRCFIGFLIIGFVAVLVPACGGGDEDDAPTIIVGGNSAPNLEENNQQTSRIKIDSVTIGRSFDSGETASLDGGRTSAGNTYYTDVEMPDWENLTNYQNRYQKVWLQVNTSGAEVDRYEWRILGWENDGIHGGFAYNDYHIEIDLSEGIYEKGTYANNNTIRYDTAANKDITACHTALIEVTALTTDHYNFANAYFTIYLRPYGWSVGGCR